MDTPIMTIEEWRALLPVYRDEGSGKYGWRRCDGIPALHTACYADEGRAAKVRDGFHRHYAARPSTLARYTEARPEPSPIIPVGAWSYIGEAR